MNIQNKIKCSQQKDQKIKIEKSNLIINKNYNYEIENKNQKIQYECDLQIYDDLYMYKTLKYFQKKAIGCEITVTQQEGRVNLMVTDHDDGVFAAEDSKNSNG